MLDKVSNARSASAHVIVLGNEKGGSGKSTVASQVAVGLQFTRKDGSRVPILIGGATFEDGGNQGVAYILDLTERKRAEQALMRSEAYLAETQKLTHTGSWAWDARSQKVLYCFEVMFRIFGLDPQEHLPTRKDFRQRVHPEDRNRVDERFARVVNERVDSFDEYRVLLPDGTVK